MCAQVASLETEGPQPSHGEGRPVPGGRLAYIDNLRTVLITTVVLGHLGVTYGADFDWYYYESGEVSPVAYVLIVMAAAIAIGFAMGLFFMIGGYFTAPAYDHRGAPRFLVDRAKRLGIPWLFYAIVINPLVHYAVDVHGGDCRGSLYDCRFQGSFWEYLQEYPRNLGSFGDGPVWFLEALLIFSVFYALWRLLTERLVSRRTPGELTASRTIPGNVAIALFALAIGLSTFLVRLWFRAFVYVEPWHLELGRFPQYAALFVTGLWAYRRDWFVGFSDLQARPWRWVALGCVLTVPLLAVAAGATAGTLDERGGGGMNWLSLAYSLWEGFLCVSMVIVVPTWFRRRFDHQGRLARAMSESSFAVYVLHPAIIVPLALGLSGVRMNLSLKYVLVAPVAVALCYLIAHSLRKIPLVRAVLG